MEYKGDKVIKRIYRKEEIYHGSLMDNAPDLVLMSHSGFRLRGLINKDVVFDKDIFTGLHTLENAFLYVKSPNLKKVSKDINVEDFYDILKTSL